MYYDINRVLVADRFNGQKWFAWVQCELELITGSVIVFDVSKKEWKYQSTSTWNSYLISIGNLKLSPTQKLDTNDKIVNKTYEELYLEGLITKDEYIKIQATIINSDFEKACSEIGVDFEKNKYQYDDVSRARLLEVKDDARVNFWRSVDNVNVTMTNSKKNELYEVLKLTYYTKFAEKSAQIDALGN
jgi:hypothetical protein